MKLNRVILPFALSMSLMGCQTMADFGAAATSVVTGQNVAQIAPVTVAAAEKGLSLTLIAYNWSGEQLLSQSQPGGFLYGDNARIAGHYYDLAGDSLNVAIAADNAANAQGIMDAIAKSDDAITQLKTLLDPKTILLPKSK